MTRIWILLLLVGIHSSGATAGPSFSSTDQNYKPWLTIGEEVPSPVGSVDFCRRLPDECYRKSSTSATSRAEDLKQVNDYVNKTMIPMTDLELYGKAEFWTLPLTLGKGNAGDCEDYAMEKRRFLMDRGWRRESLRLAVADTPTAGLHLVLVVRTSLGDYVLDNLVDDIKPWMKTGYRWVSIQSSRNPSVYLDLTHGNE